MDKLINSGIHQQYQMNICYTSSCVLEFQTTDRPLLGVCGYVFNMKENVSTNILKLIQNTDFNKIYFE